MADSEKSTEKENPENFKFRAEKEVKVRYFVLKEALN
jgi:hypothetical protein